MADLGTARLYSRTDRARTIDELTTLFDLCLVVVDAHRPAQLAVLAPLVERLDRSLGDADCTFGLLVVGADTGEALALAGPLADRVPVFADPETTAAPVLGLTGAPALVWVDTQPALRGVVVGWDAHQWRPVLAELARKLAWTKPLMPAPGDPASMAAQPFQATTATSG